MDQILDPRSLKRAAPLGGFVLGAAVALVIAVLPEWRLEAAVSASGLDRLLASARSPLGATARSALALMCGGLIGAGAWGALSFVPVLLARRSASRDPHVPVLRRADAHPDAPPRRPLRASEDLGQTWGETSGEPLPIGAVSSPTSVPDEGSGERVMLRALPDDLDTPLAAIDPTAIPEVPREPVRLVASLARPASADQEDVIETFELTPIRRSPAAAAAAPTAQPSSLTTLLDRLEQGAARRVGRPAPSLEDTLGMLRGLAAR